MKLTSSWRLPLAMAVLAMFVAFATWPGAGTRNAEADVADVVISPVIGDDGSTIAVNITGTAGVGATLTVTASGTSTLSNVADTCTDNEGAMGCGTPSGSGTGTVLWDTVDGAYTATVALTLDCSEPTVVTVTATDDGLGDSDTILCVPELSDPQVVIEKDSDDDDEEYNFDWDASGGNCVVTADDGTLELDDDGSFDLEDGFQAEFFCDTGVNLVVSEDDDADFVGIDDCDEGDEGVDDISGSSIEFDISDIDTGETVFCTFVNDEDFSPTPTVVVGNAASVSMVLSSNVVDCGQAVLVQVLPRSSSGGPVAAGTTITMSSSLGGDFQPASSVTSAFDFALANFLYTAPNNVDGTTVLTARAGSATSTATVEIECGVAPPVAPTSAPLTPPSAGDGGLLESSGFNYLPAIVALLVAGGALGVTGVAIREARRRE